MRKLNGIILITIFTTGIAVAQQKENLSPKSLEEATHRQVQKLAKQLLLSKKQQEPIYNYTLIANTEAKNNSSYGCIRNKIIFLHSNRLRRAGTDETNASFTKNSETQNNEVNNKKITY